MQVNEDQNQNSGREDKKLASATAETKPTRKLSGFTTLNQEFYKDDNGREVAASVVEFLAPYCHICDGFYKWECGRCGREDNSRACGWAIAGQVLKCGGCGAMNLLVKTNTVQLDELVSKKNNLDLGLMRLASDRAAFDSEVNRAASDRLRGLETPLRSLLANIEASKGEVRMEINPDNAAKNLDFKQMWRVPQSARLPWQETAVESKPETADLKNTEMAALDAARKLAKAKEEEWYQVVRSIDARIDALEEAEMKAENTPLPCSKGD